MEQEEKTIDIQLSVVQTQSKYSVDEYSEAVYGDKSIVSYGKDNDMPILLRNCYRGSATLKAVIDKYVNYILGDGISVNEKIAKFAKVVNAKGMTPKQFIASIALDYMIYGGFCFQVINSKLGTKCEFIPLDFSRARTNESGSIIYYSKKNWSKWGTKSEAYPRFNPDKKDPTSIFYFKGDFTKNVYPLPLWYGALYDVLTEIECSKYSLNAVSNGFSAKHIINLPNAGNLTKEQKDLINKEIKERFTGTETESNFMLYFGNSDKAITVSKVESDDTTDRFIAMKDNARSNIYTSLSCSPMLAGLPTSNGWSTTEYRDNFKIFQKCSVEPIQDIIVEAFDRVFERELGGEHAISITPFNIEFDTDEQ